jgi:putative endonuclease
MRLPVRAYSSNHSLDRSAILPSIAAAGRALPCRTVQRPIPSCAHDDCRKSGVTFRRQALGRLGEDLACGEIERRGYAVLTRRYRTRYGELDIVAQHEGMLVFIEVKTRDNCDFGHPAEAVTPEKMRRLYLMATDYVARGSIREVAFRFDVVAVEMQFDPPRVTVYRDAFRPGW